MMKKTRNESDRAASARYHANHIKRLPINLNDRTDQDIMEHLRTITNVQGYLKELIRHDMNKVNKNGQT